MLKKKLKIQKQLPPVKQIWGKLLTRLRESGEPALFVACGEISEMEIVENKIIAKTDKDYLFNLISTNENKLVIKRTLRFLGFELDFDMVKIQPKDADALSDIESLKEKFGEKLVVE